MGDGEFGFLNPAHGAVVRTNNDDDLFQHPGDHVAHYADADGLRAEILAIEAGGLSPSLTRSVAGAVVPPNALTRWRGGTSTLCALAVQINSGFTITQLTVDAGVTVTAGEQLTIADAANNYVRVTVSTSVWHATVIPVTSFVAADTFPIGTGVAYTPYKRIINVVLVGDSIPQGVGAAAVDPWGRRFGNMLCREFGPKVGDGFRALWLSNDVTANGYALANEEWSFSGVWTRIDSTHAADVSPFSEGYYAANGTANIVTWNKPDWIDCSAGFAIYWIDAIDGSLDTGQWSYSVDNGAWVNMTMPRVGDNLLKRFFVATPVTNNVRIRAANAAGATTVGPYTRSAAYTSLFGSNGNVLSTTPNTYSATDNGSSATITSGTGTVNPAGVFSYLGESAGNSNGHFSAGVTSGGPGTLLFNRATPAAGYAGVPATNGAALCGIEPFCLDPRSASGVVFHNVSMGGRTLGGGLAPGWNGTGSAGDPPAFLDSARSQPVSIAFTPDLIIMALGTNDHNATTPTHWRDVDLPAFLDRCVTYADVLLIPPYETIAGASPTVQQQFRDATQLVADNYGVAVLDIYNMLAAEGIIGLGGEDAAALLQDEIHPTPKFANKIASAILRTLRTFS